MSSYTKILFIFSATIVTWSIASFSTSAAPAPKLGCEPIEAHDLALEIHATGRLTYQDNNDPRDWYITCILKNLSKNMRTIDVVARGNRLDDCGGITFLFWFPDGSICEMNAASSLHGPSSGKESRPITLPSEGYAYEQIRRSCAFSKDPFRTLCTKNNNQFCMTAVIGWLEVQSNTIQYNGCPLPPPKYVPLQHSSDTPEAIDRRRNASYKAKIKELCEQGGISEREAEELLLYKDVHPMRVP